MRHQAVAGGVYPGIRGAERKERWPALSGQVSAVDKWNLCRLGSWAAVFGVARREGVARPEWLPKTTAEFMLPRPAAGVRNRRGPASERQGSNAGACGCKSSDTGRSTRAPERRCRML